MTTPPNLNSPNNEYFIHEADWNALSEEEQTFRKLKGITIIGQPHYVDFSAKLFKGAAFVLEDTNNEPTKQ